MHVGHIKAYSGLEVVSRKRRMEGYNVLFPIGFDAFGLPTENYAMKTGIHPRKVTDTNIAKFTSQLRRVGFSFDWTRTVDTTDESYYKWTQWIFLKMFEKGLVFRDTALVNYCPSCKVVLSNEDSQGGKCDICHSDVVQRSKDVWYLRITEYADKLLSGLDEVDYLPNIKQQQVNWIGKSTGAFVNFPIKGTGETLRIYTTPRYAFGVTSGHSSGASDYRHALRMIKNGRGKRVQGGLREKDGIRAYTAFKEKDGVKAEAFGGEPLSCKEIPVYIADYVMMGYGTGALWRLRAYGRDYEFAKKFGADIIEDRAAISRRSIHRRRRNDKFRLLNV